MTDLSKIKSKPEEVIPFVNWCLLVCEKMQRNHGILAENLPPGLWRLGELEAHWIANDRDVETVAFAIANKHFQRYYQVPPAMAVRTLRKKCVAMVSPQGTACLETALYGDEDTPMRRQRMEVVLCVDKPDAPIPGSWIDVTHNDAFYPEWETEEDIA